LENLKETNWKTRHRWKNNIKTNLNETGFEDVDWVHLLRVRSSGEPLWTW